MMMMMMVVFMSKMMRIYVALKVVCIDSFPDETLESFLLVLHKCLILFLVMP